MKRTTLSIIVGALVVPLIATSVPAASARPVPGKTGHQGRPAADQGLSVKDPVASPQVIAGYRLVNSRAVVDAAGRQTEGTVTCPSGFVVIGGGAVISNSVLTENINSSYPLTSRTWDVFVNNAGTSNGTFAVYAVCAKKVAGYALVLGMTVANPAGAQSTATATCPGGTVPLGGGGFSNSTDLNANMNTTVPLTRGWRVDINNGSSSDSTAAVKVVCGKKPTGYAQVVGPMVSVNPGSQLPANAECPANTAALGGGGYIGGTSVLANLNTSVPLDSTTWQVYENNGSTSATSLTARVVCGQIGN